MSLPWDHIAGLLNYFKALLTFVPIALIKLLLSMNFYFFSEKNYHYSLWQTFKWGKSYWLISHKGVYSCHMVTF